MASIAWIVRSVRTSIRTDAEAELRSIFGRFLGVVHHQNLCFHDIGIQPIEKRGLDKKVPVLR